MEITQELVKELFEYRAGLLLRKVRTSNNIKIGEIAGYFNHKLNRFYIGVAGKSHPISRIIFLWHNGYLPEEVDHINGNPYDNRIENLRAATHGENMFNRNPNKGCISKYRGVSKHCGKWQGAISKEGKKFHLGTFNTETEAALAYNKSAVKLHGEFANLNIISETI
jgi:hypothetical protein